MHFDCRTGQRHQSKNRQISPNTCAGHFASSATIQIQWWRCFPAINRELFVCSLTVYGLLLLVHDMFTLLSSCIEDCDKLVPDCNCCAPSTVLATTLFLLRCQLLTLFWPLHSADRSLLHIPHIAQHRLGTYGRRAFSIAVRPPPGFCLQPECLQTQKPLSGIC